MTTETPVPEETPEKLLLPSNVYDILKPIVQIILPGLGTLYFALAGIWDLPKAEEVVGTIAAVTVFLGLLLGISTKRYNNSQAKYDGAIQVSTDEAGKKQFLLVLNEDPYLLDNKSEVLFKMEAKESS